VVNKNVGAENLVMKMSVWRVYAVASLVMMAVVAASSTAYAQYRPSTSFAEAAIGEDYHIEASYGWWNASPSLIVNSESLEILGTDVDLVSDLGIEKKRLGMFDLVLKAGRKHRFRYQRLPLRYETDAFQVQRRFIFNGQSFDIGIPVTTSVDFTTHRFGYEYDFLYFRRGFIGALVDLKYTNVDLDLRSPIHSEFVSATAPIPTVGVVGRGYVLPNLAVNAELTLFRTPDGLAEQLEGDASYTDFDINGTFNFNKNVGFKMGYRRMSVFYDVELDTGDLKFKGLYFGGVVRY
jgi:hypothetical protein